MPGLHERVVRGLQTRNVASRMLFDAEALPLARACRQMGARFLRGGRLIAFGVGSGITDAQHVAVEFVHPVIVGKRALPAFDASAGYDRVVPALSGPDDIVMGFGSPCLPPDAVRTLEAASARGAQTFALSGPFGDFGVGRLDPDPFVQQELIEILYHTLWETVHVFLEHAAIPHDAGPAGFLYPFLNGTHQDSGDLVPGVADSIRSKAAEVERLRDDLGAREADTIVEAVRAIHDRLQRNGKLLLFGNGGSATDATDWAMDCVASPKGHRAIPALSLGADAAILSALANDVGHEAVFVRQLIAYARPGDVAVAITTSGGSANILAGLVEARRRGLLTVALAGYDGGEISRHGLADFVLVVGSDFVPRIQEVHASLYHLMLDLLNAKATGEPA